MSRRVRLAWHQSRFATRSPPRSKRGERKRERERERERIRPINRLNYRVIDGNSLGTRRYRRRAWPVNKCAATRFNAANQFPARRRAGRGRRQTDQQVHMLAPANLHAWNAGKLRSRRPLPAPLHSTIKRSLVTFPLSDSNISRPVEKSRIKTFPLRLFFFLFIWTFGRIFRLRVRKSTISNHVFRRWFWFRFGRVDLSRWMTINRIGMDIRFWYC